MSVTDPIGVLCPCCNKTLYRQVIHIEDDGREVVGSTADSPRIEDGYMTCAHCACRIAFERVATPPSGLGWQMAPRERQNCGK